MSNGLRIFLFVIAILIFEFIVRKIRKSKLKIEYALFWIISSFMLLIISIFPQIAFFFTEICGIKSPSNFIFLISFIILFVHNFVLTIKLSKLDDMINSLTEELAVREYMKKKDN